MKVYGISNNNYDSWEMEAMYVSKERAQAKYDELVGKWRAGVLAEYPNTSEFRLSWNCPYSLDDYELQE